MSGNMTIRFWSVVERMIVHTMDGQTHQTSLTVVDEDNPSPHAPGPDIQFTSSNPAVATVTSAGVVTYGQKPGAAVISALNPLLYGGSQQVLVLIIGAEPQAVKWVGYTGP